MLHQVERPERPVGAPQGMLDGRRPTRQGEVREVREALECLQVADEHLPTPDGAIFAIARPVEGDAAYRPFELVFGHGRDDVRMMMLHGDRGKVLRCGPLAGEVFRMLVVCDEARLQLQHALVGFLRLQPRVVHGSVLHVADMLRHEGLAGARQAKRVLLLGTRGENHLVVGKVIECERQRRKTTGSADDLHRLARTAGRDHTHHRIVVA